ncbi:MAG TPA: tetratricopeptide repeat protein [Kofleriaceae bacterium]
MIDLVRRDPASPAFIDLAEAYLALGRPKDAATVGKAGLDSSPDNLEGRVVLARAYCALHQWKEAQGELLRVVKVDRSNRMGFALLGEVLLRRNDYERAVPVLQHAQNLDPTSPQILSMLKRARGNQPLDPPPPVPQAVPPRGETNYGLALDDVAPRAASPARAPASNPMPAMAIKSSGDMRGDPTEHQPQPYGSYGEARPAKKVTAPPPMSVEGVRPRVIAAAKPQNAAAASLRQSAAVGETYLNDLLTGGLLDVAGVRVPDSDFDLRPDRRWGRSTRRAFIFLFVVLVLGIGGGGTWYWWTEKQKSEAVARLQTESKQSIGACDFAGLEASLKKLGDALEKDNSNLLTFAYVVETAGLESLLYGTDTNRVDQALKAVAKDISPGQAGSRELVIGKAAVELSRLSSLQAPASTLGEVRKMLDEYLAKHEGDKWARWLKARALLAAGERKEAQAVLKLAADGDDGLPVAMIDQADLLVDEGKLDDAIKLYDGALKKSKDHPLAVLGKALALAESTVDSNAAIDDLSVKLDKNFGPRVTAYRNIALALAKANIEDYTGSAEALNKSTANKPPVEPRFWARVAWAHYIRGELPQAAIARGKIAWFGKKNAEDDPAVMLVDAALLLAAGQPDKVLETASKIEGIRPRLLRAYAELDEKKPKDAIEDCNWILERAKENVEAQILKEQARMMVGPAKETVAASEALEKLAKKTKSKMARHALGMGYFVAGDLKNAQPAFEAAVKDLGEDAPNPLVYRSRTALAQIYLAAGNIAEAGKQLDEALKVNPGYFPTRVLQARIVLSINDPDRALALLVPIRNEFTSPEVDLLTIEAGCASKKTTAKEKNEAKAALVAMKDKAAAPPEELSRVAAICDPGLPKELGLPEAGKAGEAPKPAKASSSSKRKRR